MKLMVELNQLKKQQNRKNMKCKVASKVIAASMAVAMEELEKAGEALCQK